MAYFEAALSMYRGEKAKNKQCHLFPSAMQYWYRFPIASDFYQHQRLPTNILVLGLVSS